MQDRTKIIRVTFLKRNILKAKNSLYIAQYCFTAFDGIRQRHIVVQITGKNGTEFKNNVKN